MASPARTLESAEPHSYRCERFEKRLQEDVDGNTPSPPRFGATAGGGTPCASTAPVPGLGGRLFRVRVVREALKDYSAHRGGAMLVGGPTCKRDRQRGWAQGRPEPKRQCQQVVTRVLTSSTTCSGVSVVDRRPQNLSCTLPAFLSAWVRRRGQVVDARVSCTSNLALKPVEILPKTKLKTGFKITTSEKVVNT
jgi:hypothetical protein